MHYTEKSGQSTNRQKLIFVRLPKTKCALLANRIGAIFYVTIFIPN